MAKFRSGLCGAVALFATVCLPISASAATLPAEDFTLSIPAGTTVGGVGTLPTSAFNKFNPSLGTLTGVSATLTGSLVWTESNLGLELSDFLRLNLFAPVTDEGLGVQIFDTSATGTFTESVSLNGTISVGLSQFEGTTNTQLRLETENSLGAATIGPVLDPTTGLPIALTGTITYTYIPATPATPLPATLPLFATGLGALGLLGWRRKRRKAQAA